MRLMQTLALALVFTTGSVAQTVSQYTFAQSSGTYTAITGGTLLVSGNYDNSVYTVNLPTSVLFAGDEYSTMYVSTNGFVTFGSAPSTSNYTPISSSANYAGAISAFGCDVENSGSGSPSIRWQQVGNEIVVQWTDARRQNVSGERISFQIRLNTNTAVVRVVYGGTISAQSSTNNYPLVGLRGANNTFSTNVNNRRVDQSFGVGSSWSNTAAGNTSADECRFNNSSANRYPAVGQTYTWTPPCLPPTAATAGADQSVCIGGPVTLAANTPTIGTGAWSVVSGPSTSTAQFSSLSNPAATFTPAGGAGTYTLRWTISNNPCTASTDNVVVTVNANPTTANAGTNQTICAVGGTTLAANSPSVGTGAWSVVSGPSTSNAQFSSLSNPAATFTPAGGAGTYVLRWTISNNPCTASTSTVTLTANPAPTSANAGINQTICITGSATLAANTPAVGTGAWSVVSGPSSSTAQFSNLSSPNATFTPAGGAGTYTLRWTISNNPCTASTDNMVVTVNANPTTANAGANQTICAMSGTTLAANSPSVGTGAWSVVSGPSTSNAQFSSLSNPAATFTPAGGAGTYVLRWTISNGSCTASQDNVTVTAESTLPAPGTISGAASICANSNGLTYSIPSVSGATDYVWTVPSGWSIMSGQGTPSIEVNAGAGSGDITVMATNSCGATNPTGTENITIRPTVATGHSGYTSMFSKSNGNITCNSGSLRGYIRFPLSGLPAGAVVTAANLSLTNNNSVTASGTNNNITGLNNTDPVTASAGTLHSAIGSGASYSSAVWSNTGVVSLNLNATGVSAIQTRMNGAGWIGMGLLRGGTADYNFFGYGAGSNAPALTLTYTRPRSLAVSVTPSPTTASVGGPQAICTNGTTTALGGNTPLVGTGGWSVVSGGAGVFGDASDGASTFTHTGGNGPIVLRWTISNAPCEASTADLTITVNPQPNAGVNGSVTLCALDAPIDLFSQLSGSPDTGGSWSGPSPVVNGLFDPQTMSAGNYVYTVNGLAPCADATATVQITVNASQVWYADVDGDGAGDAAESFVACDQPMGYVSNSTDLCPNDANKTAPGVCGCGVADVDSDGDGILDCLDSCPSFPGQNGDACDAGPGFVLGTIVNCGCVGQMCTADLVLEMRTDGNGMQTTWEIRTTGTNILVRSGGGWYPNNATLTDITCLPDGCYYLRVFDAGGDGIANGGYILRTLAGAQRIIDNRDNFTSGSVSAVLGNGGFCLPLGTDKLIYTSCDKLDWVDNQFIVASENPAVSAQFGVNNANSGYQFWWFDPNGSYGYSKFRSHATSDGFGTGATRACHARINNWSPNQIPANVLMNVKVRSRVNGVNSAWGPVCRFKIDPVRAACPLTKLMDIPGNASYSCGVTRIWGGNSLSKVVARPVDGATQYQFRFVNGELPGGVVRTTTTPVLQLNWTPALPNGTYQVQVRAFKNGQWCTTNLPWGDVCNVTITGSPASQSMALPGTGSTANAELAMFPNPNNGEPLTVSLSAVEQGVETVSVDIFDLNGARVSAQVIAVNDGLVYQVVDVAGLADGLYLVNITAGAERYTERLVIAK